MDAARFDRWTRSLGGAAPRRALLRGIAGATLGVAAARFPKSVDARRKHKTTSPFNEYGCLDAGKACDGNSDNCCSGLCHGAKPRKGAKDTSTCIAHHTGSCQTEQNACLEGQLAPWCGPEAACYRTTGKAGFCGAWTVAGTECTVCTKDTDCEADFGPGAACVVCTDFCPHTGNTLCVAAAI